MSAPTGASPPVQSYAGPDVQEVRWETPAFTTADPYIMQPESLGQPAGPSKQQTPSFEKPEPILPAPTPKPTRFWGFLPRATAADAVRKNYTSRFTGRWGLKRMRQVYWPQQKPDLDPEKHTAFDEAEAENWDDPKGEVVKRGGKFEYRNEFHQVVKKFEDVAVYLSPTQSVPRRLVVQASPYVLRNHREAGDWIRTQVQGNVPVVLKVSEWALAPMTKDGFWHKLDGTLRMLAVAFPLQVMLGIPGMASWEDNETTDSYTDFPGFYWDWPKYATSALDMSPGRDELSEQADTRSLDVRRRAMRPRRLVMKTEAGWVVKDVPPTASIPYVFISYSWDQFEGDGNAKDKIRRMAQEVTENQGLTAYWLDGQVVEAEKGKILDYDVYTMCDIVRGSACVAIMLGENTWEARRGWGRRMWTLPEGLLAPDDGLVCCYEVAPGALTVEKIHKVQMTSSFWSNPEEEENEGGSSTRVLAEHFSGVLTLSRLELLPAVIRALKTKGFKPFTSSDLAYAVMGLLHYRIERSDEDSLFQSLARLSLSNDSDQIIERMLSVLPRPVRVDGPTGREWSADRPVWEVLTERDQYGTRIHHITPTCDVVGVAADDETVLLDGCRAIHIRWKNFPQAIVQRRQGFKKLMATLFVTAGLYWLLFGANLAVTYLPFWTRMVDGVHIDYIAWLVSGFLFVAILLSAFSPLSVRRLFGGTVLKSSPNLVAFEGVMPIAELEKVIFGNSSGRLTYAPSATPFSRHTRHPRERRGVEPEWIKDPEAVTKSIPVPTGHRLFTLVDMGELSVTIFTAERPPTVALLCGREGGMLRAVLCSWRFPNDCLYKETVVRMPSTVFDAAKAKGWLKLCLKTQNQARLHHRGAKDMEENVHGGA